MQDRYVSRAGVGQPRQTRMHQSPHHLPGETRNKGRCAAVSCVKHFHWHFYFRECYGPGVSPCSGGVAAKEGILCDTLRMCSARPLRAGSDRQNPRRGLPGSARHELGDFQTFVGGSNSGTPCEFWFGTFCHSAFLVCHVKSPLCRRPRGSCILAIGSSRAFAVWLRNPRVTRAPYKRCWVISCT